MTSKLQGFVEHGWGGVADAFRKGFDDGREVGASFCAYHEGRVVVDLWGGQADARTGDPWRSDTVAVVFSTTKGAVALCVLMLSERGSIDLDAPVINYWPAYGQNGKERTLVSAFLDHEAGVPNVDIPLTLDDVCNWTPVLRALELQPPLWEPGLRYHYHALTAGFLLGELVQRVAGRSIGRFFREEIAEPLGLHAWIGMPFETEERVAPLIPEDPIDFEVIVDRAFDAAIAKLPAREMAALPSDARREYRDLQLSLAPLQTLGGAFPTLVTEDGFHNDPKVRAAEIPSTNMVADARSLARMYASAIGEVDGVRLLQSETVEAALASQPRSTALGLPESMGTSPLLTRNPFARGFWRLSETIDSSLGRQAFGHPGAGGSIAGADPEMQIAFAYVPNKMASNLLRASELASALARVRE